MNQLNSPVRETEMSKAISGLHNNIASLHDKIMILKSRLECVSIEKPCVANEKICKDKYPSIIRQVLEAEENIEDLTNIVVYMLDALEI